MRARVPSCKLYLVTQVNTVTGLNFIALDAVAHDTDRMAQPVTGPQVGLTNIPGKILIRTPGIYLVTAAVTTQTTNGGNYRQTIVVVTRAGGQVVPAGQAPLAALIPNSAAVMGIVPYVSDQVRLGAGDTLAVQSGQDSAGNATASSAILAATWLGP
jgi:hypothetical protein